MVKSVIKELIIVLLLCLAIILILGILLYEYVPASKTIPNEVSYTTPEEVKEELMAAGEVDESKIVMTYEIDSATLNNYKRIQNYKPGKANPFADSSSQTSGSDTSDGSGTSTSNEGSSNTSENNNSENTSGGQFFKDTGTK